MTDIGEAIKTRRQQLNMSQEDLAARLGISTQQLQRYEYGKSSLRLSALHNLAEALQVPVLYFFGENKEAHTTCNDEEREMILKLRSIEDSKTRNMIMDMVDTADYEDTDER